MKRRIIGGALLLALAGALAAAYRSDRFLFEAPAKDTPHYFNKVGHFLAKHHGLAFLMTFDEARPVEWVGRGAVHYPGTESVPGRIGQARRFDGRASTHVETSACWPELGSNYTLSLWLNLESTGMDQEIWYTFIQKQRTGFKLRNGQMTFFVPGGQPEQAAAYPFEAFGRFVHLVGVVDGSGGEARLYENGALKAAIPVAEVVHPSQNLEFGKTCLYAAIAPFRGTIDEAAAWKRTLSPKEIRALARARHSLPCTLEPFHYWHWRAAQAVQTAIPDALRLLDRFNPLLHKGPLSAADLPEIYLQFSSSDARHFIRAHDRSLASGRRTASGANPRRIDAQYDGHTVEAQIWLDGSDTYYPASRRPGYLLETPPDVPAFGARLLHLMPPENMASRLPKLGAAITRMGPSNAPAGLCRLTINGLPKGIYYYESFDQRGLMPGERAWVAKGPHSPLDWQTLFRGAAPSDSPTSAPLLDADLDVRLNQVRPLLVNDIFHPWSAREWTWRLRKCRAETPPAPTNLLSAYAVLGQNPSPYYVVGDLDLPTLRDQPGDIAWHSSRPDLIAETGKVTRPAGDAPVGVDLVATILNGEQTETIPLRFRVMPQDRKLPALMLYVDEPLTATHRVDFSAEYHPAHDEGFPRRLQGGQATGGGIKHRGNTSYWRGQKKPFSLRFDEPHCLVGDRDTPHLYLLNGYVDSTKLHNKLVFDLFRAFGGEGRPRYAPEFDWTEVFVNGAYWGVYEMCTRIDENMVGFAKYPERPATTAAAIYKIRPSDSLFAKVDPDAFEQVFPSTSRIRRAEPLLKLMEFTSQADATRFAREIDDWIDLDNAIDFLLLLNFAGNVDGRTTNFFLARGEPPGSRFFFIPWDYDHTFAEGDPWLSNFLFERLRAEIPDFMGRAGRRWGELRQGLLSDAAVDARIQEMAGHLTGYMDWEYEFLQCPVPPTYPDKVEALRQAVQTNLRNMDARFLPAAANRP